MSDANKMLTRKVAIVNQYGIHARPAAMMVRAATRFAADIFVEKDGTRVSGKSIMGLMTLEASKGSHLLLLAQGADAEQALDELAALVEGCFGEE